MYRIIPSLQVTPLLITSKAKSLQTQIQHKKRLLTSGDFCIFWKTAYAISELEPITLTDKRRALKQDNWGSFIFAINFL